MMSRYFFCSILFFCSYTFVKRRNIIDQVILDIGKRTKGDIYLGIVGPVRTGKSTFIKRFMELAVIPFIEDE